MTTPVPTTAAAHLAMVEALREASRGGTTYKKSKTAARAALEGWEKRGRLRDDTEARAAVAGALDVGDQGATNRDITGILDALEPLLFGTGPRTGGEGG